MRRRIMGAIALLALTVPASADQPGAAVGRLDAGRSTCTGVLIAPDRVLTAAHCVMMPDGSPFPGSSVVFRAGRAEGAEVAAAPARRVVLHPDYVALKENARARLHADAALIELAWSLDVPPVAVSTTLLPAEHLSITAYARARPEAAPDRMDCGFLGRTNGVIAAGCTIEGGASGAPLLQVEEGVSRLVGVVVARSLPPNAPVAFAVPVDAVLPRLEAAAREP